MSRANLINAALFQTTWFACVLGGAAGSSLWGAAALLGLLTFSARSPHLRADLRLAAAAAVIGFALDTLWIHLGVLDYHGIAFAPAWIVLLWVAVGLTLNHSLSLFAGRPWLGGVLAGACAPLSYLGGERLGAVAVPDPWLLALVAAAWFFTFALAFALAGDGAIALRRQPYERAH
ncbi:MAG: DUF2878 domain-containing protein [Pseudomonadales bacterium]